MQYSGEEMCTSEENCSFFFPPSSFSGLPLTWHLGFLLTESTLAGVLMSKLESWESAWRRLVNASKSLYMPLQWKLYTRRTNCVNLLNCTVSSMAGVGKRFHEWGHRGFSSLRGPEQQQMDERFGDPPHSRIKYIMGYAENKNWKITKSDGTMCL